MIAPEILPKLFELQRDLLSRSMRLMLEDSIFQMRVRELIELHCPSDPDLFNSIEVETYFVFVGLEHPFELESNLLSAGVKRTEAISYILELEKKIIESFRGDLTELIKAGFEAIVEQIPQNTSEEKTKGGEDKKVPTVTSPTIIGTQKITRVNDPYRESVE